jgi:hypothetical protein
VEIVKYCYCIPKRGGVILFSNPLFKRKSDGILDAPYDFCEMRERKLSQIPLKVISGFLIPIEKISEQLIDALYLSHEVTYVKCFVH